MSATGREVGSGGSSQEIVSLLHHDDQEDEKRKERTSYTYEEAINVCGYGRFQVLLLVACGWANAGDAVEVLATSFILPSAECDLQLTSQDKGWMNAVIFVGMLIGGYLFGSLSDTYGRRITLISSLIFNGIFAAISSFAQSFPLFLFFRFLSGIGVGGNVPTVWSYFVEFQSMHRRGSMLSLLASFWMFGNVFCAGLAWAIIPHTHLGYPSWRLFVATTSIPCLTAALLITCLPESPKFLMEHGLEARALTVLQHIHAVNHSNLPRPTFPVKTLKCKGESIDAKMFTYNWKSRPLHFILLRIRLLISHLISKTKELFTGYTRSTLILLWISFSLSFGYYGLWLWFPELYKRMEALQESGSTHINVCSDPSHMSINHTIDNNCSDDLVNTKDSFYTQSFILAISTLPGNLFTIACVDRLGRKILMALSMFVCGISVFFIYFVTTSIHNIVLSCVFGGVSVITWNILDCLGVELFPTSARSTALGLSLVSARIGAILGNIIFGELIDSDCIVPIMMVAALLISGGFCGCLLPNTTQVELM